MEKTYNKTTNIITKAHAARQDRPTHPAEKTSKKDICKIPCSTKKPSKVRFDGPELRA